MSLLPLIRAAADQRGTTQLLSGIEVAHTICGPVVSIGIAPSDSIPDLRRSLRAWRHYLCGGYAHLGYWEGSGVVWRSLGDIVRQGEVRLGGHSLGGAIAVCLAHRFRQAGIRVTWLETYGAPSSLSASLAAQVGEIPGRRYWCGGDPIPLLWPDYRHERPATRLPSRTFGSFLDHRLSSYETTQESRGSSIGA